jgi:hypothetical protein
MPPAAASASWKESSKHRNSKQPTTEFAGGEISLKFGFDQMPLER